MYSAPEGSVLDSTRQKSRTGHARVSMAVDTCPRLTLRARVRWARNGLRSGSNPQIWEARFSSPTRSKSSAGICDGSANRTRGRDHQETWSRLSLNDRPRIASAAASRQSRCWPSTAPRKHSVMCRFSRRIRLPVLGPRSRASCASSFRKPSSGQSAKKSRWVLLSTNAVGARIGAAGNQPSSSLYR